MARILVVDDSAFQRKKICRMLERAGHQTYQAVDGQDALRNVESGAPDMVVTDLNMPNMTGMEFLSTLREQGSELPVLVVTSDVQDSTREECMMLGAAELLNKPVNEDRLRIMVEGFIGPGQEAAS